jgi:3-oxoacyl-[acyl-carrier protein] reductase
VKSDLRGTVSLVTGAAQGIGRAIADRLAANGSRVVYSDVNLAGAIAAAEACGDSDPTSRPIPLRIDVTKHDEIAAAVTDIVAQCGTIDILVNNAGANTLEHRVPIVDFPREEWDRLIGLDLTAVFEVSQQVARVMCQQNSGRIINIASVVGLVPFRSQCAFNAAKAGVIQLTKAMALELAPNGVLVNAICPGSVLTEATQKLFYGDDGKFHDKMQRLLDHVPLGRPATVDEISVGALYLADPDNTYTTGHILTIDGGWTSGFARDF